MLTASVLFAVLLSGSIIFAIRTNQDGPIAFAAAFAAGTLLTSLNFLWRKLYKRKVYEKGVVRHSGNRTEFVAAKGDFIKWVLFSLSCSLLLLYVSSLKNIVLLIICSPFALIFFLVGMQNLRLLFQRGPILITTDEYLEYRGFRHYRIAWNKITEASMRSTPNNSQPAMFLALTIEGDQSLVRWYNFIKKIRYRMTNKITMGINLNTLEASVKEVSDIVSRHIDVIPSVDWRWKDEFKC